MRAAMDPSPTAVATRFTEPTRTSPAAKTPGMLDSRERGARVGAGPLHATSPGADVAIRVTLQYARQPIRLRVTADQDKEGGGWHRASGAGLVGRESHPLQPPRARGVHHLRAQPQGHVLDRPELANEIIGHRLPQALPARHQRHLAGEAGKMAGRLAG